VAVGFDKRDDEEGADGERGTIERVRRLRRNKLHVYELEFETEYASGEEEEDERERREKRRRMKKKRQGHQRRWVMKRREGQTMKIRMKTMQTYQVPLKALL
jgi:hypothetical protein